MFLEDKQISSRPDLAISNNVMDKPLSVYPSGKAFTASVYLAKIINK
jgi:hypothetical protein